jgi:N-carbamoyl-L-amino-acid hydrolase
VKLYRTPALHALKGRPMLDQMTNTARINIDRLWSSIHEVANIGPGVAGGCNRQALTDYDA